MTSQPADAAAIFSTGTALQAQLRYHHHMGVHVGVYISVYTVCTCACTGNEFPSLTLKFRGVPDTLPEASALVTLTGLKPNLK